MKFIQKVNRRLVLLLIAFISITGIGAHFIAVAPFRGNASAAAKGTLVVALRSDPESLDPYFVYHPSGFVVLETLYDSLVMADERGRIVPHLAKQWTVLDDTTIEFTLRTGVTFHNGEPFDAESVKYSIERVLDESLQSGLQSDYAVIEAVQIVSPDRVRIHLARPESSIIWRLSELAIVPPKYAEAVGPQGMGRRPVGTGPFRFVEMVRDSHVIVEANDDYFGTGSKPGPGVERIVFRIIPEPATRIAELRAGNVHIIEHVPVDMASLVTKAGAEVKAVDTGRFFVAWFAGGDESPLADVKVRQALNYAIDTETVIDALLGGYAVPIASPFTPGTFGFDPTVKPYHYDIETAKDLLAEAGYPDGFTLTIDAPDSRTLEAQLLAGLLRDIGIDATVRPLETSLFNANWTSKKTGELILASWGGAGDPQRYLDMLIKSDGFLSHYANAAVDELLSQSAVTLDTQRRQQLLAQVQRLLHDDPAAIYLWSAKDLYGVAPAVVNWRPRPTERLIVSGIALKERS